MRNSSKGRFKQSIATSAVYATMPSFGVKSKSILPNRSLIVHESGNSEVLGSAKHNALSTKDTNIVGSQDKKFRCRRKGPIKMMIIKGVSVTKK